MYWRTGMAIRGCEGGDRPPPQFKWRRGGEGMFCPPPHDGETWLKFKNLVSPTMQHTSNRILKNFALDAKFVQIGNLMKIYEFLNALTFLKPIFMNCRAMHLFFLFAWILWNCMD